MKGLRTISIAAVSSVAIFAVAAGAGLAGGPKGPAEDSVYGGGRHAGGGACTDGSTPFCPPTSRELSIDAHASPSGRSASGRLLYGVPETGSILLDGDVACLEVDGNRAVVGGFVNSGPAAGNAFFIQVEDLGEPGSATRDRVSPVFLPFPEDIPAGFPRSCPTFDEDAFGVGHFVQPFGDLVVRDR